jgi:hypothetical protein
MQKLFFSKYSLAILFLTVLVGCQDIAGPVADKQLSINTISKWKVDTLNDTKLVRVLYKEFDVAGFLILQEDFSENGTIIGKSTYSYNENKSLEQKSSYNETGEKKEQKKIEYEYDSRRRVIKQITYNVDGTVNDIHTFDYDVNGNVVKKTLTFSSNPTKPTGNLNIDYLYSQTGELVERVTNEGGNLSRDSISYNNESRLVTVYRFNTQGGLSSSTEYLYNHLGNIITETNRNSNNNIISKYLYEYTYHTR